MDEEWSVGDKVIVGNGKIVWEIYYIAPSLPWCMLRSTESLQHRSENFDNLTKVA